MEMAKALQYRVENGEGFSLFCSSVILWHGKNYPYLPSKELKCSVFCHPWPYLVNIFTMVASYHSDLGGAVSLRYGGS